MAKNEPKTEKGKLAADFRKKLRNLRNRMKTTEKHFGKTPGIRAYEDALKKGKLKTSTRGKSKSELEAMHREIDYLSSLKTTTKEGAQQYDNQFKEMEAKMRAKGKDDIFWKLYKKMVEEHGYEKKAKYEYMAVAEKLLDEHGEETEDELLKRLDDLFGESEDEDEDGEIELNNVRSIR